VLDSAVEEGGSVAPHDGVEDSHRRQPLATKGGGGTAARGGVGGGNEGVTRRGRWNEDEAAARERARGE
jgi:hypothetical protein